MISTWMGDHTDHSGVEVDAVVKNTVKFQEWRNGASTKTILRQTYFDFDKFIYLFLKTPFCNFFSFL